MVEDAALIGDVQGGGAWFVGDQSSSGCAAMPMVMRARRRTPPAGEFARVLAAFIGQAGFPSSEQGDAFADPLLGNDGVCVTWW